MRVFKEVEVQVDLEDFTTDQLVREIKSRRGIFPLDFVLELLREQGCPKHILDELSDWNGQTVLTRRDWDKWMEFAGVRR